MGTALLGLQMLLIAFGALVLVPLLTELDPNVALFTAGAGTLIFQLVTRRRVPVFLASSFVFLGPIIYGTQTWGLAATLSGLFAAGAVFLFLALLIKWRGIEVIEKILPAIVTGPVIMLIGLMLAPVAVNLATGKSGDGSSVIFEHGGAIGIALASLTATIFFNLWGPPRARLLSILLGMLTGYLVCIALGVVDFSPLMTTAWIRPPQFVLPEWNWEAIIFMIPVAIAPAIEHFGDMLAIRSITDDDYFEDPGIHRTLMGDGLATMMAAGLGGPPNTTYSEVTGGVALTKAFDPKIMTWASICAILLSFVGKLGAFLQTIPTPVMGGILVVLFGAITVVGLNILVKSKVDLMEPRNLIIVGVVLVLGVGGFSFSAAGISLKGVGLAAILGVVLNAILPDTLPGTRSKKLGS